jgi:hypothetical protein
MESPIFGTMNINYSPPNELTQGIEIPAPRAVRVVRTIRIGLPGTATASGVRPETRTTKSKESSFQIGAFAINHPDPRHGGPGADRTNWFRLHFCTADRVVALLNLTVLHGRA